MDKIELSEPGFEQLCRYFVQSYAKDDVNQNIPLCPGLEQGQAHLADLSQEAYHLFNTCNVWTERGLRIRGFAQSLRSFKRSEWTASCPGSWNPSAPWMNQDP